MSANTSAKSANQKALAWSLHGILTAACHPPHLFISHTRGSDECDGVKKGRECLLSDKQTELNVHMNGDCRNP